MKLCLFFAIASITMFAADDPYAAQLFQKHCASCHNFEAGAGGRVPQISALKSMTPAAIQKTLESGVMKQQAAPLSPDERQRIATFLGTAVTLERKPEEIANSCPPDSMLRLSPAWASWGGNLANTRFQPAKDAGLSVEDLPRLKLKWAFAFPDTSTMRSQPAVYRGKVFAGGQDGSVYALDMKTGCVYWATTVQSQVRSGITLGEAVGNPAVFFADSAGFVYALDATSGKQLWKARADEHPASTVTATPVFYKGRLYVGAASREESLSVSPGYLCCTFRGSESALDAATGKVLWKTYTIGEVAKARPKTRLGATAWGPSGVGVWTAPVLDPERDTMYVTTGDNYSDPPTAMSDALLALRMSTGEILWSKQFTAKDAWNSSCQLSGKVNCPDSDGPDFDFASSAIMVSLPECQAGALARAEVGRDLCRRSGPARPDPMASARRQRRHRRRDRVGLGHRRTQCIRGAFRHRFRSGPQAREQRPRLQSGPDQGRRIVRVSRRQRRTHLADSTAWLWRSHGLVARRSRRP